MKILYTNFHCGSGGGHTTYIRELARGLSARHEVHVAVPEESRLLREVRAIPDIHAFAQSYPNGLRALSSRSRPCARLRSYLQEHQFDIVHVNGSADHRLVIAALRGLSRRPHIVLTKHNTKPMRGLQHVWRARFGTDKVIAVCDFVRRQLDDTAYRHCRPETVYNGVDTAFFSPAEASEPFTSAQPLKIGSNAGTADYKGWMDLAEALKMLTRGERERIRIIVAGQPPSAIQREALAQSGMQDHFHFPGLLDDVRPMIAGLDVGFVLSHDIETISFACREMMSMGKPVMVTDYAGLPENIAPGIDGWIVPVHGCAAMANALRDMLNDREGLLRRGKAARQHAIAEFRIETFLEHTEAIYMRLLEGAPSLEHRVQDRPRMRRRAVLTQEPSARPEPVSSRPDLARRA